MRVSIITVCYNSESTIEETIKSVLGQTYDDIEYIVIDGSSMDTTCSIIKKYEVDINHFISEPDKGLYDAMNKGVKLATGELIGILNSDDVFHNDSVIEKIAEFHQKLDIDASISNVLYKNDRGRIVRKYSAKDWSPEKLKIAFMPPHAGLFLKRYLFESYGYYKLDYQIAADFEIITRFFLKNKISWNYFHLTTTVMRTGGISSSGLNSYRIISKEIIKSLSNNEVAFNWMGIHLRFFRKILSLAAND
ncbi:glycosyltransferase [Akkermansiaceae bacterium]|nr:glycosyltransferase [Akkermansiaceae bacterium]MDB4423414.1 glycosyltransferase [bacterium]